MFRKTLHWPVAQCSSIELREKTDVTVGMCTTSDDFVEGHSVRENIHLEINKMK